MLTLSNIQPDPEDILAQLQAELANSDAWRGNVETQVGQTILRMVAAVGALGQAKIRRNLQDVFPETAVSDRAAYALAVHQGVRINRKLPAEIEVTLTSQAVSTTVPAYSTFQGGGSFFFNREAVFLPGDTPVQMSLFQGIVKQVVTTGIGLDYSLFGSQEGNFVVSDLDVVVKIDGTTITRTIDGMWKLPEQAGFVDRTTPDGKLLVEFGNNQFGSKPDTNETIEITYVVTAGEEGNGLNTLNKSVTATDFGNIVGTITSQPTGGANQRPPEVYKNIAAPTFGTFGSAITRPQYITTALQYPGVVDVVTFAQREVNPFSKEWMNLIKIVPLTESYWGPSQRQDFLDFMQEKTAFAPFFFIEDPSSIGMTITANVYCVNSVDVNNIQALVVQALIDFFQPRAGILNFNVYLSDIVSAIKSADPGIEYIELQSPTEDLIINGQPLPAPTLTVLNGLGSLPVGVYYYGIAVTTPAGNITVRSYASVEVTVPNSAIKLDWTDSAIATGFDVYGRLPGALGKIASVSSSTLTYTDFGSVSPVGSVPAQNTLPVRYVQASAINITAKYSTRGLRSY